MKAYIFYVEEKNVNYCIFAATEKFAKEKLLNYLVLYGKDKIYWSDKCQHITTYGVIIT